MTTLNQQRNQRVGLEPWYQPDRAQYLDNLRALGAERAPLAFRARLNLNRANDWLPDVQAIDAFRTHNENATRLIVYSNLFSVHRPTGEALLGDMSNRPDWFLYDADAQRVHNPRNGRHCLDFADDGLIDYFVSRGRLYLDAGVDGFEFDSFRTTTMKTFENGYWHAGYSNSKYFDPIEVINPRTGSVYTEQAWADDLSYAVTRIKTELRAEYPRFTLFVNGMTEDNASDPLIDGIYGENWCSGWDSMPNWWFNSGRFDDDIAGLVTAVDAGKLAVVQLQRSSDAPWAQSANDAALYGAACGLFGASERTFVSSSQWERFDSVDLERFVPVGPPRKLTNGLLMRRTVGGMVCVNANREGFVEIALPEEMLYLLPSGEWSEGTILQYWLSAGRGAVFAVPDWEPLPPPDKPSGCLPVASVVRKFITRGPGI